MKSIQNVLKNLPRTSREQIYLEAAARAFEVKSEEWEQHFFSHCADILSQRLQTIKGIGEESALELLETLGDFLNGN